MSVAVKDGLIDEVTLHRETFWLLRWDVWPFLIIYGLGLVAALSDAHDIKVAGLVAVPLGLTVHLVIFLFAQSSNAVRAFIGKTRVSKLADATWVQVKAAPNAGRDRLVPVLRVWQLPPNARVTIMQQDYPLSSAFFQYQEVTYYYDGEKDSYVRLSYPTDFSPAALHRWTGHQEPTTIALGLRRWGLNEFHIPVPHFLDLYMVWPSSAPLLSLLRLIASPYLTGALGGPVLRVPSAVSVPVESGRLLVLFHVHAHDAAGLRGGHVHAASEQRPHDEEHAPPCISNLCFSRQ